MKWFDENRGMGLIRQDNGREFSVHFSDIEGEGFKTLDAGDRVLFRTLPERQDRRAVNVRRQ